MSGLADFASNLLTGYMQGREFRERLDQWREAGRERKRQKAAEEAARQQHYADARDEAQANANEISAGNTDQANMLKSWGFTGSTPQEAVVDVDAVLPSVKRMDQQQTSDFSGKRIEDWEPSLPTAGDNGKSSQLPAGPAQRFGVGAPLMPWETLKLSEPDFSVEALTRDAMRSTRRPPLFDLSQSQDSAPAISANAPVATPAPASNTPNAMEQSPWYQRGKTNYDALLYNFAPASEAEATKYNGEIVRDLQGNPLQAKPGANVGAFYHTVNALQGITPTPHTQTAKTAQGGSAAVTAPAPSTGTAGTASTSTPGNAPATTNSAAMTNKPTTPGTSPAPGHAVPVSPMLQALQDEYNRLAGSKDQDEQHLAAEIYNAINKKPGVTITLTPEVYRAAQRIPAHTEGQPTIAAPMLQALQTEYNRLARSKNPDDLREAAAIYNTIHKMSGVDIQLNQDVYQAGLGKNPAANAPAASTGAAGAANKSIPGNTPVAPPAPASNTPNTKAQSPWYQQGKANYDAMLYYFAPASEAEATKYNGEIVRDLQGHPLQAKPGADVAAFYHTMNALQGITPTPHTQTSKTAQGGSAAVTAPAASTGTAGVASTSTAGNAPVATQTAGKAQTSQNTQARDRYYAMQKNFDIVQDPSQATWYNGQPLRDLSGRLLKMKPGADVPAFYHTVFAMSGKTPPVYNFGTPYDTLIRDAADRYHLDPAVLAGLIKQESRFNPRAVSGAGAMGLTQLMPGTVKFLKVNNPFDPAESIDAGARYLSQQVKKFGGNYSLALAAYNAGPGNVRKYGNRIPPFTETQNYVTRVLGNADAFAPKRQTSQGAASPAATSGRPTATRTSVARTQGANQRAATVTSQNTAPATRTASVQKQVDEYNRLSQSTNPNDWQKAARLFNQLRAMGVQGIKPTQAVYEMAVKMGKEQPRTEGFVNTNKLGILPVSGTLTSDFGYRRAPTKGASTFHRGVDIAVPVGTPVPAMHDGVVSFVGRSGAGGNTVKINCGDGREIVYHHLSTYTPGLKVGQQVSRGMIVARSGNTGVSSGPHLHYTIKVNGKAVDPLRYRW